MVLILWYCWVVHIPAEFSSNFNEKHLKQIISGCIRNRPLYSHSLSPTLVHSYSSLEGVNENKWVNSDTKCLRKDCRFCIVCLLIKNLWNEQFFFSYFNAWCKWSLHLDQRVKITIWLHMAASESNLCCPVRKWLCKQHFFHKDKTDFGFASEAA